MSPLTAIVGVVIYVAFFSKIQNFADANILEYAFMDARQKSISNLIKFSYMTFTLAFLMLLAGIYFREFKLNWVIIVLTWLLILVYLIAMGLKYRWDSHGKMAPIVRNTIDNHNKTIKTIIVVVLLLSASIIGSYVVGTYNYQIAQSPESIYVIKFIVILISAGFLNAWLIGILRLLNYKPKLVRFYVDNEWFTINKVLLNGIIEVQSVATGKRYRFTPERLDNCEFEIVKL